MLKIFILLLLICATVQAQHIEDESKSVWCNSGIIHDLKGKSFNEKISNLGNDANLGGIIFSDELFLSWWRICGREYTLLSENDIIRDVAPFPEHSRIYPQFLGECYIKGGKKEFYIAILDNKNGKQGTQLYQEAKGQSLHYSHQDETLLPAIAAWKIDEKAKSIVEFSPEGLYCPRNGITTEDGGP